MSQLIWFVLALITFFLESYILAEPDSVQKNASPTGHGPEKVAQTITMVLCQWQA